MTQKKALLDDFFINKSEKGRLFDVLTAISILYIASALLNFAIDLKTLSVKEFNWQTVSIFLALPFLGLIFHLLNKKIGWIINCFYYLFVALATFYDFIQNLFSHHTLQNTNWPDLIPLAFAVAVSGLLFSTVIRKYFRINTIVFVTVCSISVGLVIIMFTMIIG